MKLSTSFVAVKKISSSTSSSKFDSEKIEQLARQILNAEGIISPLILQRTSLDSYEVIDGHFAYHAAVRAREIDGRKGETIAAYIIESDGVASDAILQQIELIRRSHSIEASGKAITQLENQSLDQSLNQSLINAIENSIAKYLNPVNSTLKNIDAKLEPKSSSHAMTADRAQLTHLTHLSEAIASLDRRIPQLPEPRPDSQLLADLNNQQRAELTEKLAKAGLKGAALNKLVNLIIETRPYTSFSDLLSRKESTGKKARFFTEKTLIKLLDI